MTEIILIILGLIAGYREVQILCDRGSWNYLDFRNWFWFTNQAEKKESWRDSFHVSGGLFALVLCIGLATCTNSGLCWDYVGTMFEFLFAKGSFLNYLLQTITLWVLYMYARNMMMHVILPLKPDWWKIIPLFGDILENFYKKITK